MRVHRQLSFKLASAKDFDSVKELFNHPNFLEQFRGYGCAILKPVQVSYINFSILLFKFAGETAFGNPLDRKSVV